MGFGTPKLERTKPTGAREPGPDRRKYFVRIYGHTTQEGSALKAGAAHRVVRSSVERDNGTLMCRLIINKGAPFTTGYESPHRGARPTYANPVATS